MLLFQGLTARRVFWNKFFATMPTWARYAVKAFFAYALINFVLFIVLSKGGAAEERDGKYVLQNHGKVIRELSEEEYELQEAYVIRGFSGHWMIFYLVPALFFRYGKTEPEVS